MVGGRTCRIEQVYCRAWLCGIDVYKSKMGVNHLYPVELEWKKGRAKCVAKRGEEGVHLVYDVEHAPCVTSAQ